MQETLAGRQGIGKGEQMRFRFLALASAGVAAGALALTVSTAAFAAPITAVSVSANPASFSGMVGTPLSPAVTTTVTLDSYLQGLGSKVTVTEAATGLPAGVSLAGNGSISGTPTAAGNGTATVTATAVESPDTGYLPDLANLPGCQYSISGPSSFSVSGDSSTPDTYNGVAIASTGEITVNFFDNDPPAPAQETLGEQVSLSQLNYLATGSEDATPVYMVTKTCVGSVNIPWAVGAVTTPPAPVPPTTTLSGTTPSGGVQTGGGLAPRNDAFQLAGFSLLGLAVLTAGGGVFLARRRVRQGS